MSEEQTVIYTARTSQDAHLLRNLLAELGIKAVVTNEVLGGGGVGMVGWPMQPQVVVAEDDAPRARQIALEFENEGAAAAAGPAAEEPPTEAPETVVDAWPRCPECDARRSTKCPICETAGTDFSPVDMGFTWVPDPGDAAGAVPCSCGSGGCAPHGATAETEAVAADEDQPESPRTMLICSTCDEPFEPEYPRVCEWCGHEFDDGFETALPQDQVEQLDARVIAVIVALLVLAAALVAYFMFIV